MELFHRTMWKNAKSILLNGFKPFEGKKTRVESGLGIYCVTTLCDANRPYNKKHYGNAIVKIVVPDNLVWEHGTKADFMHRAKAGDNKSNRIYTTAGTNGEVAVLYQVSSIISLEISRDNGKTWYSSI